MNRSHVGYMVVAVIILVAGYFFFSGSKKSTAKSALSHYYFKRGEVDHYHVHFVQQDQRGGMDDNFTLEGDLYTKVKKIEDDVVWLMVKLDQLRIKQEPIEDHLLLKSLQKLYQQPFLIKLSTHGAMQEFIFKGEAENYGGLEQMLYSMDIPLLDTPSYSLKQEDKLGVYQAYYRRDQQGNLKKEIQSYLKLADLGIVNRIELEKAQINMQPSTQHNWFDTIEGRVKRRLYFDDKLFLSTQNRFLIEFKEISTKDPFGEIKDKTLATLKKQAEQNVTNLYEEVYRSRNRELYKNVNIKQMVDRLDDRRSTYYDLADYLESYPQGMDYVVKVFSSLDEEQAAKLIGVLSLVINQPKVQSGVVDIYHDSSISPNNQISTLITLGFTTQPTEETISFLEGEIYHPEREISNTALLGLGRLSRYHRDIVDRLLEFYDNAGNFQRQVLKEAFKNGGYDLDLLLSQR